MHQHFEQLADAACQAVMADEVLLLNFSAESGDFVRFNHGKVRQAGRVEQAYLTLELVLGQRHATHTVTLAGTADDLACVVSAVAQLRSALDDARDDPWLLLNRQPQSTHQQGDNQLPATRSMVDDIVRLAHGLDLVGILAAGAVMHGFANNLGQRNWHATHSWNFDWSVYAQADKAIKRGGAGYVWDADVLARQLDDVRGQLARLSSPAKVLTPGSYRAWLAPAALNEVVGLLNWGGFSEKEQRTKRSPLLRLAMGQEHLSPLIDLSENLADGLAPAFQEQGFVRPGRVDLIRSGQQVGTLVAPRTAQEYQLAANAADGEAAESLDLAPGGLAEAEVLRQLDTGIYIANLWYLNYTDRATARITGMTRFACFWVEGGQLQQPLEVMRFDDTLARMLGSELVDLGAHAEWLADASSYDARSTGSTRLPGALLQSLQLVL